MPGFRVTTNFFVVLTILADSVVVVAIVGALAAAVSRRARYAIVAVGRGLGPQALLVAWVVAIVTTLGSLYYSEHIGFVPCDLCWYQRIAMYPLVVVLGVGWLRRDRAAWITALPFVVVGAPLSLYHWLVERVPAIAETSSCSVVAPCSAPYFERLGFVTLAWMCLSSFVLIGVLLVLSAVGRARAPAPAVTTVTVGAGVEGEVPEPDTEEPDTEEPDTEEPDTEEAAVR